MDLLTNPLDKAQLYFHTARHLKLSQLYWRARYRIASPATKDHSIEDSMRVRRLGSSIGEAVIVARRSALPFLNMDHALASGGDWNDRRLPKLWLYNLHYFDWLQSTVAIESVAFQHELMRLWIAENAFGQGNGWEPYPIALRIVNWVKFARATEAWPRDLAKASRFRLISLTAY